MKWDCLAPIQNATWPEMIAKDTERASEHVDYTLSII